MSDIKVKEPSIYDFRDEERDEDFYKVDAGLTEDIIREISKEKHDPEWMLEFRLNALKVYKELEIPNWGPPIDGLDMSNIVTYVKPKTKMVGSWDEVPDDIKNAFEKLGIPQAEREALAGVGAQYDSEIVYHNVKKEVEEQGVVYTDMESPSPANTSRW